MAEFTATVYQNEFLPDGGTDVNAIVTVTCTGAGTAGQTGAGSAGEIIIVDTSGSMGRDGVQAAAYAAQTALDQILDGVWFAVISGNDRAQLVITPGLGGLSERRLRGCLSDLTLPLVRARVVAVHHT